MKTRVVVTVLSVVLLVLAGSAASFERTSAADKTAFTATEIFDPFELMGPPVGEFLSPGTVTCPGFEPTGNPLQPCPTGSLIHIRDLTFVSRVNADVSDPRLGGWMTVMANANYDANATGPVWGTFSVALDAGGTWDGTFQGIRGQEGNTWVAPLHASGQGTGGVVDGMQMLLVDRIVDFDPAGVVYIGSIQGRILDPHGK